jgi:hypothetical protein
VPTVKPHPYRESVRFFAGKYVLLFGVEYSPGDEVPRSVIDQVLRVRSLIDTRKLIAVEPDQPLAGWQRRLLGDQLPDPVPDPEGKSAKGQGPEAVKKAPAKKAAVKKAPAKKAAVKKAPAKKAVAKKASPAKGA